jgi:hypothetical protein
MSAVSLPESRVIDGRKYVSADDLNQHIQETIPVITAHGISTGDSSYALGMIQGLMSVGLVLDLS